MTFNKILSSITIYSREIESTDLAEQFSFMLPLKSPLGLGNDSRVALSDTVFTVSNLAFGITSVQNKVLK